MNTARQILDRLDSTLTDAHAQAEAAVNAAEQRAEAAERELSAVRNELSDVKRRRDDARAGREDAERVARSAAKDAADAIRRAEQAEAERDHEAATREQAQQDAAEQKGRYERACRTIAEMHEAATGRTGMGPIRGVVEDVADVRARAELLDQELNRRSVYTAPSDAAEERIRSLTHQVAELRQCNTRQAETIRETTGRANQAELDASRAEAALARVRNARTTTEAWAALGTYYGLTATEAGRRARAWRTTDEREHDRHRRNLAAVFARPAETPFEELTEYAAKTLTRSGERLLAAGKRADTAEAAMSRVRALHSAVVYNGRTICTDCSGYADGSTDNGPAPFPCLTLAALDTPEEG